MNSFGLETLVFASAQWYNKINMNGSTVTLPKRVFRDLVEAGAAFERAQSELEDYILAHSKVFVAKMRRARKEHGEEKFATWVKIKSKYGI